MRIMTSPRTIALKSYVFILNYLELFHVISKFLRLLETTSVTSNYFYSQVTSANLHLSQYAYPQFPWSYLWLPKLTLN
jgi:hypothetical protein